jgi:hypothetical protein
MPSKTIKTTTAAAVLALGLLASQPATAADSTSDAFTFGVIGDIPYGDAEIAKFPARIQDINADSALKFVTHDAPMGVKSWQRVFRRGVSGVFDPAGEDGGGELIGQGIPGDVIRSEGGGQVGGVHVQDEAVFLEDR